MSQISISLDPPAPEPGKSKKAKKEKKPAPPPASPEERERARRRALVSSVIIGSIAVHAIALVLFGLWTVAKHFSRPEARFEVKKSVKIPPKPPEHKMNVAKHEAMAPKPTFNDKLVSTRPIDFALPEMPQVNLDQMLPLDPSELISDQVSSLVGSAALGAGLGQGLSGGGGTGDGMSFFGVRAQGDRILLLFDVSLSVKNKAEAAGIPLERIQEETLKLIEGLPISAQFSIIQFTQNYLPFTDELIAATPANKEAAREWVERRWVTGGSMASSASGVVANQQGAVGVLERAVEMRPDVIFLISDGSFHWRPGGSGIARIPHSEFRGVMRRLESELPRRAPIHFIAFEPRSEDAREWTRIVRRTGGEFRELR